MTIGTKIFATTDIKRGKHFFIGNREINNHRKLDLVS